ncbi:MAG TPA: glycosyl hydrolase 53 family protein [Phenylobacterium sp.]|nr:glycosyl hydrolase 53 family protein [Phenylobacterium sp.]
MTGSAKSGASRRTVLAGGAAVAGLTVASPGFAAAASPPADAELFCAPLVPFRTSLSVSPFTEAVVHTTALTDGAFTARTVPQVQQLFMRHGATEVYARIATRKVAPQGAVAEHGWAKGLERARLARDLGLPFNPELGLWAEYGDGGNYQQPPDFTDYPEIHLPGPWTSLTLEQMLPPIRQYAAAVAKQILATGAHVPIWDIGNEVEPGIAGVTVHPMTGGENYQAPDNVDPAIGKMSTVQLLKMSEAERVAWCKTHLWPSTGRILAAAAQGIRSVAPSAKVATHISPIGAKTSLGHLAFVETCKQAGFLPDQFGMSYYPGGATTFGGPADAYAWLKETTQALKTRYGRPSFIAEGGVASGKMPPPFTFNAPVESYPLDEAGQYAFNRDMIAWGAKSGCLAGYRPWAPDLCIGADWAPMSWFDQHGATARAKPVMRAFEDALPSLYVAVAQRGDGPEISLRAHGGQPGPISVELKDDDRSLAHGAVAKVGADWSRVPLAGRTRLPAGVHTLVVRRGGRTLLERRFATA